jgi:3-methyladenine DNA glycosylase AlkD
MNYELIHETLMQSATRPEAASRFFKTGEGEYGAHDQFIGVPNPVLRSYVKQWKELATPEILRLLSSPINEERLLALFILIHQYQKGNEQKKEAIYQLYLAHIKNVNNWNLVDASARDIMGAYLFGRIDKEQEILLTLVQSPNLWERRIAIVSTWYFIRKGQFTWTLKLAELLLNDKEDLMHKAVGWMLREMGDRDVKVLKKFLDTHASKMPRAMLRYAIEKLPESERKAYMQKKLAENF